MAFRTKKISQMDPKGSNLASTDLLEISELVSGSYVTKSITGAEIIASVPPTTVDWGDIGGTLSAQTDLNTALSGKQATVTLTTTGTSGASTFVANTLNVPTYSLSGLGGVPTSRTLTINGTTQDLSADRTFTISTGITIGTTAITSGTVGRVLFEGTGNVVQESGNFSWDNTNAKLLINGGFIIGADFVASSSAFKISGSDATLALRNTASGGYAGVNMYDNANTLTGTFQIGGTAVGSPFQNNMFIGARQSAGKLIFVRGTSATESMTLFSTGNFAINTTTDAGFKLDVNGTERVTGGSTIQTLTIGLGAGAIATNHALGFRALEANTTGSGNTGVGYIALLRTTTGASNVALGSNVLQANITGSNNVGVGFNALKLITANHNVGVGTEVLSATTTGQANTAIGNYALNIQTTGGNNVALGYNTQSGNFSGCVIIGKDAVATANNQFVVGSTGTNAGTVTTEVNASTQVWNVIINGVARKILLA